MPTGNPTATASPVLTPVLVAIKIETIVATPYSGIEAPPRAVTPRDINCRVPPMTRAVFQSPVINPITKAVHTGQEPIN